MRKGKGVCANLCVERKIRLVAFRWNDLDDAKIFSFWSYLLYVLKRILELLRRRIVSGCFLQPKYPRASAGGSVAGGLDRAEIEGHAMTIITRVSRTVVHRQAQW